jgi:hypothetical protein
LHPKVNEDSSFGTDLELELRIPIGQEVSQVVRKVIRECNELPGLKERLAENLHYIKEACLEAQHKF